MRYFAIPETDDDCELPTMPEPLPLEQIGKHLAEWLERYRFQGYYSNCRRERIALDQISFRITPDESEADQ